MVMDALERYSRGYHPWSYWPSNTGDGNGPIVTCATFNSRYRCCGLPAGSSSASTGSASSGSAASTVTVL